VRWRLRDRGAALIAVLYFVALLGAAAASTPRRVGDGGEYVVMAMQLASWRGPSVSSGQLAAFKDELLAVGGGFESSLLDYPDLVAADGGQDFLHFFLYPLVVAPVMSIVRTVEVHPNWAFTVVNALLLAGALFLIARHVPLIAVIAGFVSPIIWWVDKAHTEAFLFALVSVAAVVLRHQPSLALIAFACAGAQNAALGIAYPLFAGTLWLVTRRSTFTRRSGVALGAGALIVFSPFLYTWMRLGRWSPMAEYAQRIVPSLEGSLAFVLEPNIGLLPNAPVYGVVLLSAAWILYQTFWRRAAQPQLWWWPAVLHVLLIVVWSQNPNANHGGTPGVNRWVLSLLALGLPWIAMAREQLPPSGRIVMNVLVAVPAVLTAAAHLPSQPENYRTPTPLAERLWSRGWVRFTPAEVFAERSQGREPAVAPGHDGRCDVLLIADQRSPVQCVPPIEPLPAWCRSSGAMCYALPDGEGRRYIRAPANGFYYQVAEPSWPAGGPLATGIRKVLLGADSNARAWRVENSRRWRERFAGADLGVVLSTPDVFVAYILRLSWETRRRLEEDPTLSVVQLLNDDSALTNVAVVIPR
jgi:hypothetical protein